MGICFLGLVFLPFFKAQASIFTKISGFFVANSEVVELPQENSQTMNLLEASTATADAALVVDHNALAVSEEMLSAKHNPLISTYTVKKGDTLEGIAKMFQVSVNTVLWSNNLSKKDKIKEGQLLVILPVTGVSHMVVKGDTIQTIAKKYKADVDEILSYNGLVDNGDLKIGDKVIIPDGEISAAPVSAVSKVVSKVTSSVKSGGANGVLLAVGNKQLDPSGYFIRPVVNAIRSQGIHGYNGIDLANKIGTPIIAAAEGTVVISKSAGYNGGYGNYIVISHSNGMQTLYSHLSEVEVSVGETVTQGEQIGKMGVSGKVTGSHLHFEVRGGKNPF